MGENDLFRFTWKLTLKKQNLVKEKRSYPIFNENSSFRLVHLMDGVPHLPACEKNDSYPDTKDDKGHPCLAKNDGIPYHHGVEIWFVPTWI